MQSTNQHQKGKTITIVLLLTFLLLPAVAGANMFGDRKPGRHDNMSHPGMSACSLWRNPEMTKSLGLNDQQVQQLKDADFAFREKRLAIRAQLSELHLKMDKAMSTDSPDEAAVLGLAKQIADVKGQLFVQTVESRLTAGKVLTAEQRAMLKAQFGKKRDRRGDDQRGPRDGSRNGMQKP